MQGGRGENGRRTGRRTASRREPAGAPDEAERDLTQREEQWLLSKLGNPGGEKGPGPGHPTHSPGGRPGSTGAGQLAVTSRQEASVAPAAPSGNPPGPSGSGTLAEERKEAVKPDSGVVSFWKFG